MRPAVLRVNANVSLCLRLLQDEEINQQSQLAEKLKQQMLDQDEVSTGGPTCGGGGRSSSQSRGNTLHMKLSEMSSHEYIL